VTHRWLAAVFTLLVVVASSTPALTEAGAPTDQVHAAIDDLYGVLVDSSPARRQRQERDAAATQILDRLFDWSAMARDSLREHWEERTPAERTEFTRLFAEVFRRAFVSRIEVVDAQRFQYLGDSIAGDRATVKTRIPTRRGSVISVDYVVGLHSGRGWQVQDVRIEGLSLVENYRSQFQAIIAGSSYAALVKKLRERAQPRG
jgi:phospholipid transport system substrate-binding protein